MLSDDSVLLKIPINVDPAQALYLDGIRRSIEIIDYAYERLTLTLTDIALTDRPGAEGRVQFTAAYLDAWAIVDAIYRLRGLLKGIPGIVLQPPATGQDFFADTEKIPLLRNVAAHLHNHLPPL